MPRRVRANSGAMRLTRAIPDQRHRTEATAGRARQRRVALSDGEGKTERAPSRLVRRAILGLPG